jgi:hypothetical protein
MTGRLVLVVLAAAILAAPGQADAKKKRTLCPGARFVVHERPLFTGDPTVTVDGVTFMPEISMLALRSGCPLNPVKLKARKKGTRIRGRWSNCTGAAGKVRLKALIDRTCQTMKGKVRAKRAKVKRRFVATLSRCGDGIVDIEGGEQCEAGQACGAGLRCGQTCTCVSGDTVGNTDLTVLTASVEGHGGEAGKPVLLSATIKNLGTDPAKAPWKDAVYLSRDDVFSRDDRKLTEIDQTLPLAGGETYPLDLEVTLPLVPGGDFYLIVRTDDGNQVAETNEQNNELDAHVHIKAPNLVPTQLQDQPDRDNPRLITVSWTVLNDGEAAAVPLWQDALYLSLDERLDPSDLLIWPSEDGGQSPGIVDPHQRYELSADVTVPAEIESGSYYLILVADSENTLFESSEDDNLVTEPIRVDDAP